EVRVGVVQSGSERGADLAVDGVARLGTVEGDQQDVVAALGADGGTVGGAVGSGIGSHGAILPPPRGKRWTMWIYLISNNGCRPPAGPDPGSEVEVWLRLDRRS